MVTAPVEPGFNSLYQTWRENQGGRGTQTAARWSAWELQNPIKKEGVLAAGRFAPACSSFFNEKMLG